VGIVEGPVAKIYFSASLVKIANRSSGFAAIFHLLPAPGVSRFFPFHPNTLLLSPGILYVQEMSLFLCLIRPKSLLFFCLSTSCFLPCPFSLRGGAFSLPYPDSILSPRLVRQDRSPSFYNVLMCELFSFFRLVFFCYVPFPPGIGRAAAHRFPHAAPAAICVLSTYTASSWVLSRHLVRNYSVVSFPFFWFTSSCPSLLSVWHEFF